VRGTARGKTAEGPLEVVGPGTTGFDDQAGHNTAVTPIGLEGVGVEMKGNSITGHCDRYLQHIDTHSEFSESERIIVYG